MPRSSGALLERTVARATAATQHTKTVNDSASCVDTLTKAAGTWKADTVAGVDTASRAVGRVSADMAAFVDAASPDLQGGAAAHELPVADTAGLEDLVCKTLVVLRPPRPTWE